MASILNWTRTAILETVGALSLYALFLYEASRPDRYSLEEFSEYTSLLPYPDVYVREYSEVTIMFVAFLFLNFYVTPRVRRKEDLVLNGLWILLTIVTIGVVFGSAEAALASLILFCSYVFTKELAVFLWRKSKTIHQTYSFFAPGVFLGVIFWLIGFVFLFLVEAERGILAVWGVMIPSGILLYSYSFLSLIPKALRRKRRLLSYVWNVFWVLALAELPVGVITFMITGDEEAALMLTFVNSLFQFFVTMPFCWIFYLRYKRGSDEILSLQSELGHSTAKLDFLRSQINPHFLFNALNTLYGTALQEKAERTSEAIQKLGDMMRFMLHENLQPRILLVREIDYLKNYIDLQKLRTDAIPGVSIQTEIETNPSSEYISPMLLIPFVENAFKHGISFREQSYIRVSLDISGNTLHFDVSNSNHPAQAGDPEKDKSGVGLVNVKQRLQLLYPKRHELTIRETGKEYFVHLTIQLS
jgi:two-component system LytT family sensor kinase